MKKLETVSLKGKKFSRLGMGCWAAGGHGWGKTEDRDSIDAIRYAYDNGVTFFDTADCYGLGKSERILRTALGSDISNAFIATKGGVRWDSSGNVWADSSPEYLRKAAEASLERLGIEQIPLYYIHKLDGKTEIGKVMEALSELKRSGKIGEIGVSNFTATQLEEACCCAEVKFVQNRFNILDGFQYDGMADTCLDNDLLFVAFGVLADGMLTGKFDKDTKFGGDDHRSRMKEFKGELFFERLEIVGKLRDIAQANSVTIAQLVLKWTMKKYPWVCPLFGAKTAFQVEENIGAEDFTLDAESISIIESFI
jgi:aryl-alcohol dehydrogenase-like predicted oxidoreductase